MRARRSWATAYRSHTCFKAVTRALEIPKKRNVGVIQLESDVPPCRVCRAWWRHYYAHTGVDVKVVSAEGTWRASDVP